MVLAGGPSALHTPPVAPHLLSCMVGAVGAIQAHMPGIKTLDLQGNIEVGAYRPGIAVVAYSST